MHQREVTQQDVLIILTLVHVRSANLSSKKGPHNGALKLQGDIMTKTRMIADKEEKGQERYNVYKKVMSRINQAIEDEYYLEAITLLESIIVDRLESRYCFLKKSNVGFKNLWDITKELKNIEINAELNELYENELDSWRVNRNRLLHEMAKIEENTGKRSIKDEYKKAKKVALKGKQIFNTLNKLLKRERRYAEKKK